MEQADSSEPLTKARFSATPRALANFEAVQPIKPPALRGCLTKLSGQIRTIQNDEIANYHGLSAVLRQRMTHGLSALASFTWSHTLDISSDSNNSGTPMNPYKWRGDYGDSNWDIRRRLVASFVYDVPFFAKTYPVLRSLFAAGR